MHFSNTALFYQLPFYVESSVLREILKVFTRFEKSYKVEIVDKKGHLSPLEATKSIIKDFLKEFLNEIKGFKDQITVTVMLSKYKPNGDIEYYFKSATNNN